MKRLFYLLLTALLSVSAFGQIAYASTPDSTVVVPIIVQYAPGTFSFVVSEEDTLKINATVKNDKELLQNEFIDEELDKKMSDGDDVVVTAYITKMEWTDVKDIVTPVIGESSKDEKRVVFDISLEEQVSNEKKSLTTTNSPIHFEITPPEDFDKKKADSAKLISVHNEEEGRYSVDILPLTYNDNNKKLSFETNRFSNFVLTYTPVTKTVKKETKKTKKTTTQTTEYTPASSEEDEDNEYSPVQTAVPLTYIPFQTGDNVYILIAILVSIVSAGALIYLVIKLRKPLKDKEA